MPAPAESLVEDQNLFREMDGKFISGRPTRLPAQMKQWACIFWFLKILNGKSNDRSANPVTERSPPRASLVSSSSPFLKEFIDLLISIGPTPLPRKPGIMTGPFISQARDAFPPTKNRSLIGVGLVQKSSPQGIIILEIPSFKAAVPTPRGNGALQI